MMELTMQMTVIFVARSLAQHLLNALEPTFKRSILAYQEGQLLEFFQNLKAKRKASEERNQKCHDPQLPQLYADALLTDVTWQNTELDGYNSATVQFGFVALFSVSFPLAPLLAMFHNIIQRKIDAHNLLLRYKRPFALQSLGIGVWESWLFILAYIGVAMNAFVIAFTSNYFENQYLSNYNTSSSRWVARLAFMLLFEHAVLAVQLLVTCCLPSLPRKYVISVQRQEYIERLLRKEITDEEPIESLDIVLKSVKTEQ
jgi:hypothetical protein